MAASGRGSGMVGYNVQTTVDTEHPLIVAHEVTKRATTWASRKGTSRKHGTGSQKWSRWRGMPAGNLSNWTFCVPMCSPHHRSAHVHEDAPILVVHWLRCRVFLSAPARACRCILAIRFFGFWRLSRGDSIVGANLLCGCESFCPVRGNFFTHKRGTRTWILRASARLRLLRLSIQQFRHSRRLPTEVKDFSRPEPRSFNLANMLRQRARRQRRGEGPVNNGGTGSWPSGSIGARAYPGWPNVVRLPAAMPANHRRSALAVASARHRLPAW